MPEFSHKPVLLSEILDSLTPEPGESYLDVTLGLGGHAQAILDKIGSNGLFIGIDADKSNLETAEANLSAFSAEKRFIHSNFLELPALDIEPVNMILADLGMSSVHVDDPTRGFTFQQDVPLDLRYDRTAGLTAAEYIGRVSEQELTQIFFRYGEIKPSRRLASVLKKELPETTGEVVRLVNESFGYRGRDLLPQIFQALRIAVNRELDALRILLDIGPELLLPGGRLAIISFHSLEDRLVKQTFRKLSTPVLDDVTGQIAIQAPFAQISKKPITASEEEISINPRSRSAKLRVLQKNL